MVYFLKSIADIPRVAQEVAKQLQHKIICFEGEMGAGKTTFIKGLIQALGSEDDVSSPTFSLVNEYDTVDGKKIYHFDFYRIHDATEALDIGLEDYLYADAYCMIEWPDKIINFVPKEHHVIRLEIEDGVRKLTLDN
ncbi:tRNA (adenosine(37)-N6)-threonylcarbamoyltransferase complex ATPase subunit type 1 TsaE [Vaginella massiliensis]|uniref:tRNA (adenosine(37)-N6)-threonylcarbamoyltransferase complex ATPase subunit type 1 TsaE n=1 Tax=Vaginella massiliensis TaxID=1816680 RepID=UPI003753BCC6